MKFFLYYEYGQCNDGSHSTGIAEYDTFGEAREAGDRIDANSSGDGSYMIIEGTQVGGKA